MFIFNFYQIKSFQKMIWWVIYFYFTQSGSFPSFLINLFWFYSSEMSALFYITPLFWLYGYVKLLVSVINHTVLAVICSCVWTPIWTVKTNITNIPLQTFIGIKVFSAQTPSVSGNLFTWKRRSRSSPMTQEWTEDLFCVY